MNQAVENRSPNHSSGPNSDAPFEVFYDEDCPLCRREINMIRRKDRHGKLLLTDISSPEFRAASTGKSLDELMREIHGRYADGSLVVGVDVFREIYTRLGFAFLVWPSRVVGLKWAIDRFYNFFATFRYRSALKRLNKRVCPLPSQRKEKQLDAFPTEMPRT